MNKENIFYVYLHRRKTDNQVFYVGKGNGRRAFNIYGRSDKWNKTFKKHGLSVEIIFERLSEEDAFTLEKSTISKLISEGHILVNLTEGGDGISGYRHSEDVKHKQSIKMKLEYCPEMRDKLSEGVRKYYLNNQCIKPFSGLPWLHPNAPKDVWANLDTIYDYYSKCSLTQSTLEAVFGKNLITVYNLFKSGFIPQLNKDWLKFKLKNGDVTINEVPRKAFWDIPLDCVFYNAEQIESLVKSGKGYVLISKELGIKKCAVQRFISKIKTGKFSVSYDKYIFIKERLRITNERIKT